MGKLISVIIPMAKSKTAKMNDEGPSKLECTIPILPVADLAASVAFYTQMLGFSLDWGDLPTDSVCSVSRDGRPIMLMRQAPPIAPSWVWIGLEDETLFEQYRAQRVRVLQEPQNRPWAYEMKFADLDGNVLWLGTEPRADEATAE
jgi:predicted lactoylglutathione lyase